MLFVIESGHRPLSIFIFKGISASQFGTTVRTSWGVIPTKRIFARVE